MRQASITVFLSLILTLMCSLFFSMSETVRVLGMKQRSGVVTRQALASAYSEYQPYLWEKYGILALDGAYGEEEWNPALVENRITDFSWNNIEGRNNLMSLEYLGCQMEEYTLLTDGEGELFRRQAALAAKRQLSEQKILEWTEAAKVTTQKDYEEVNIEEQVEAAQKAIEDAKENKEADCQQKETKDVQPLQEPTFDNPFEVFQEIKEKGWLGLVIGEGEVSDKAISTENVVSRRELARGTTEYVPENKMVDELLFEWYLLNQFGYFGKEKENTSLSYQVEYVIAGKDNDKQNLEAIVGRLLAMREIENMTTIMTNPAMLQQTYQMALSLAGASANPVLIQVVQGAVVAMWALVESILDVRTLLQGEKVAFVKTKEQWTSQLYRLASYLPSAVQAKAAEKGLSYPYYLAAQLALMKERNLGLRPLDLIEQDIRQQEGYENAKMDHMICRMEVSCEYQSYPIFASVFGTEGYSLDWYNYKCNEMIAY